jgi:hypothetical protein
VAKVLLSPAPGPALKESPYATYLGFPLAGVGDDVDPVTEVVTDGVADTIEVDKIVEARGVSKHTLFPHVWPGLHALHKVPIEH